MPHSIDSCVRRATDPGVVLHIQDILRRPQRELTAIVDSMNVCWQRRVAAALVKRMLDSEPVAAAEAYRFIELIIRHAEAVERQRRA